MLSRCSSSFICIVRYQVERAGVTRAYVVVCRPHVLKKSFVVAHIKVEEEEEEEEEGEEEEE